MRCSIIAKRSHPSNSQQLVWCHGTCILGGKKSQHSLWLACSLAKDPNREKSELERKEILLKNNKTTQKKKKKKHNHKNEHDREATAWQRASTRGKMPLIRASLVAAQMFVLVCRCCSLSQPFPVGAPLLFSCSNYLTSAVCQTASPPSLVPSAPHQHPPLIRHLCCYLNPVS